MLLPGLACAVSGYLLGVGSTAKKSNDSLIFVATLGTCAKPLFLTDVITTTPFTGQNGRMGVAIGMKYTV